LATIIGSVGKLEVKSFNEMGWERRADHLHSMEVVELLGCGREAIDGIAGDVGNSELIFHLLIISKSTPSTTNATYSH
jgi:hypothetical protein